MDDGGGFEIENDVMDQLVANAVCGKLTFLGFHEKTKCTSIYFVCFCYKWALGTCHGSVQFLSFLYIFPEKNWPNNELAPSPSVWSWRPLWEILDPPQNGFSK